MAHLTIKHLGVNTLSPQSSRLLKSAPVEQQQAVTRTDTLFSTKTKTQTPSSPVNGVTDACGEGSVGVVLTVAELPGDVVLLAGAVLEQAEGGRGVPGVVGVAVQRVEAQDQLQARALGKVVQFV